MPIVGFFGLLFFQVTAYLLLIIDPAGVKAETFYNNIQTINIIHPNNLVLSALLYGFLVVALLYLVRRYELNRIKLRNQLKLEKIETETLRHIDQVKSHFFANISHEFRTPLTLILGQIEMIRSSDKSLSHLIQVDIAERNAKRLLSLVNELLVLSKIEAGILTLNASTVEIVSVLKGIFFSFQSLAETKRIALSFDADPAVIPANLDIDKIEKVFNNLVSNALKFTEFDGKIKVSVKMADSDMLEIRVENTGPGIPADQLDFVFDRFYQVNNSVNNSYEGSGIGLALVKELVELHKGAIDVSSNEGANTEFVVRLPVNMKIAESLNPAILNQNNFSSDEKYINGEGPVNDRIKLNERQQDIVLIVEDNQDVREFISAQLLSVYKVLGAVNGKEGILIARETVPDLIITDIMMPVTDGIQFCREIRLDARTSHIPVIMLTARAGMEDKLEGLETGADDYITKPFSTRELMIRVRNLITQRKLLRSRFSAATIIKPVEVTTSVIDQSFLRKVTLTIETNYENPDFTVDSLAREVNMSVSQLNRKLNALIDQPAGQLMRSLRLQRAADLLAQNAGPVAQVCYQLGFNDQAYFSRAFKKQFGCSPSEFKKV